MKRTNCILRNSVLLLSLSAVSFFSSAEKFLKSVPDTVNTTRQTERVIGSQAGVSGDIISPAGTEWIDSGIRDQKNEFSLFFTKENPKIDSTLNIRFSFMVQANGDKKVEMSDNGKPNGMFFNRVVETWSLDCLNFTGHQLSKVYMMNDRVMYARRLDTRHENIDKVEKLTVFPNTDSYNAAQYYCGR
ncbi:hypothetical protein CKG00_01120 [Morganella morganii]|uniref:Uncharacterized protein n=1 Tax=Morganella morganii TaxID=582 RepID=A0A433ZSR9_MORMO|nr:hypothetical protein CKG00_01120 [Morganella morganii]